MEIVLKKTRMIESVCFQGLCGSVWITVCSLVWVAKEPVAITMQTFGLLLLAFYQRPTVAFASALFYLIEASLGWPVLCGVSSPFWYLGPSGGYLVAFPITAYLTSRLASQRLLALVVGNLVIYSIGFIWLTHFIGPRAAFMYGVAVFIPIALAKGFLIYATIRILPCPK